MSEPTKCVLCGEPMPKGEEMFNYHGYSGPCPKPPLRSPEAFEQRVLHELAEIKAMLRRVLAIEETS